MGGIRKLVRAVILGAPGSGKSTIAEKAIGRFGMEYVSSGDILRTHLQKKTEEGLKAKSFMDKGELVPDEIVRKLVIHEVARKFDKSWLLDGYPRTENQAVDLMEFYPVDVAINLVVPFSAIVERVQGRWVHLPSGRIYNTGYKPPKVPGVDDITGEKLVQREDDKPEVVLKRLEAYKRNVEPLCAYFRSRGVLVDFPGSTSAQIWRAVEQYLWNRIKADWEEDVDTIKKPWEQ